MAVHKAKYSEMPPDAVILSEDDALKHQFTTIHNWTKSRDIWVFKYGVPILASISAVTAAYINNHYRLKFRLQNYGRLSSYLPVVVIPSIVSGIFHQQFVVSDVMLQKSCPVCVQVRAASMQCVFGVIFPAIIAPLAALPFAIRYLTYDVPLITKDPMKVYNMLHKHTRPIGNVLLGLLAVHGLIAMLLTHQETRSFINVQTQLVEIERNADSQVFS